MKKRSWKWWAMLCLIVILCSGCSLSNDSKNYFASIDLTKDDDSAMVEAQAHVYGEEGFYYMDVAENMEVKVHFTLTNEEENTDIVYVTPDGEQIVISDPQSRDVKEDTIDMILLEGPCHFKLIGKEAKCSFTFKMEGIDYSQVNYLDFKPQDMK